MNIIALSLDMTKAVEGFVQRVRRFFYSVMLLGYRCPQCNGLLQMTAESACRCISCGNTLDPTVQFQRCPECGGRPELKVRRYQCKDCGQEIRSRFLFDGLVFDADYFCQKMAESRQRRCEQKEQVRQLLAESKSNTLPLEQADLNSVPGLVDLLNVLTGGLDADFRIESRGGFALQRYENHIKAHLQEVPVSLYDIPPLIEENRKDLVWKFIAIIFLAHAGIIRISQHGQEIMVFKNETDRKRQGIPGEFEKSDGVKGSVGRAEAW